MKVSELIGYARSQANIDSTASISLDDENKTVNISWKDIYARLIANDDDYFTNEVLYSSLTTYATSNPNEYKIPLPADFYRVRFIDFQPSAGGATVQWGQVHKMPLSMRNEQPSTPMYRFDSTNLWIVGANVTQIRMHYYPPPAVLTHPAPDLVYGTSYAPGGASGFQLITSPAYCTPRNTMIYVYNSTNIVEESIDTNSVTAPVTLLAVGAATSNLVYYKGYIYYLTAGKIRRAPTDLVTPPLVPVDVIATGTVTVFSIYKNLIYYTDAGAIKSANLDGTGVGAVGAFNATSIAVAGGIIYYVLAGALKSVIPAGTLIASGISAITSDGVNLYALDTSNNVGRIVFNALGGIASDTNIRTDVTSMGPWAGDIPTPGNPTPSNDRLPVITGEGQDLLAISSYADTDISYPANIVVEIMAIQAAIDFCTKLGKDWTSLKVRLGDPAVIPVTGLWASFKQLVKRDDYEGERIKNSRLQRTGVGLY